MMAVDQLTILRQAKALSEQMLSSARAKQWDVTQELEQQRQTLLNQAFNETPNDSDLEQIKSLITDILELNKQVAALGNAAAAVLIGELKELHNGQVAARAYGDCAKSQ